MLIPSSKILLIASGVVGSCSIAVGSTFLYSYATDSTPLKKPEESPPEIKPAEQPDSIPKIELGQQNTLSTVVAEPQKEKEEDESIEEKDQSNSEKTSSNPNSEGSQTKDKETQDSGGSVEEVTV